MAIITRPGTLARTVDSYIASNVGSGRGLPRDVRVATYEPVRFASDPEVDVPTATVRTIPIEYRDFAVPDTIRRQSNLTVDGMATAATGQVLLGPYEIRRDDLMATNIYRYATIDSTSITSDQITNITAQIAAATGQLETAFTTLGTAASNLGGALTSAITSNGATWRWLPAYDFGTDNGTANTSTTDIGTWRRVGSQDANYLYGNDSYLYGFDYDGSSYNPATQSAEAQAASQARQAKLEVVRQRADRLWLAHLTEGQRRTWLADGYVDVRSGSGRRYRIKNFRSANVFLLDQFSQPCRKYCAYAHDPGGYLPDGDHWFAQLLALQFNEREFLRMANTWDHRETFVGQGVDAELGDVAVAA